MTGSIGSNTLLTSNITLAALQDQGYDVDYSKADAYGPDDMDNSVDGCCKPLGWDSRKYLRRLNSNHNNITSRRGICRKKAGLRLLRMDERFWRQEDFLPVCHVSRMA